MALPTHPPTRLSPAEAAAGAPWQREADIVMASPGKRRKFRDYCVPDVTATMPQGERACPLVRGASGLLAPQLMHWQGS
eukprot:4401759-Amphidinium_carterae.1